MRALLESEWQTTAAFRIDSCLLQIFLCLVLIPSCAFGSAKERVVSLAQAHALALQEPGARPLPDSGPFSGMTHTEWTGSSGAPGGISSLAQTQDGYLWIGSTLGLYRFDGIRFAAYPFSPDQAPLPTQDVASISSDLHGGLWVGLRMTAVLHLRSDGSAVTYTRSSGLASETLDKIVVRTDGSVWVLAGGKLLTLRGDRWIDFGMSHGLGHGTVFSIYFDRNDTVWAAQDHKVMALVQGRSEFVRTPASVFFVSSMAQTGMGTLWMADAWRSVKVKGTTSDKGIVHLQGRAQLLADTHGRLWIAEDYYGLSRVRLDIAVKAKKTPIAEHATSGSWLSSPQIGAIVEDREGAIWVGTARGLDRYRQTSFEHFNAAVLNFYPSVIGARDGTVWINSHGEPLMRWSGAELTTFGKFVTYGPFAARRNGDVCFVDARASELQCYGSKHATYAVLDKRIEYAPALAMVEDADGSLLVSFENRGIWRYNGAWEHVYLPMSTSSAPLSLFVDSVGHLWMGFQSDKIIVRSGQTFQTFTAGPEQWDNTLTFCEGEGTVWAAGVSGLSFFNGVQLTRVHSTEQGVLKGISGVVFDSERSLWLNAGPGALRIRPSSVAQILRHGGTRADVEVYDERDGFYGNPTQFKPTPSLIRDAQGLLWFSTAGDLMKLDTGKLDSQRRATPQVLIQRVALDGQVASLNRLTHGILRAGPSDRHSLQVNYLALSLNDPGRMTYRYRLLGEDADWQEIGTRRQAFYTRLRPGRYTFQLAARQGQDPWIQLSHGLQVEIQPAVYETTWFEAVALASTALIVYLAYLLKVRRVTNHLRLLAEERSRERITIARDLHDTLLQGVHVLMLRFHSAAEKVTDGTEHAQLQAALGFADDILAEGRERVRHLRTAQLENVSLEAALLKIGTALNRHPPVDFRVHVEGPTRAVNASLLDEVFCLMREALTNAFEHASASVIAVTVAYGDHNFRVSCRDDGTGLDPSKLQFESRGHWGVQGMRERAAHVGAHLAIYSQPDNGTEITMTVPSSRAYERSWNMSEGQPSVNTVKRWSLRKLRASHAIPALLKHRPHTGPRRALRRDQCTSLRPSNA